MWVEKTPSGKFKACERYKDPVTGKYKRVSVTLDKDTKSARKEAQQILIEKIGNQEQNAEKAQDLTLLELKERYIASQKESGIQQNTYERNEITVTSMIRLLGENVPVNSLTARQIMACLAKADIQNTTRNNYLLRFKAMLRWGYKYDYVDDIGYLGKIGRYPESSAREKIENKYLEAGEAEALLDGMEDERWKLLTHFLLLSGLRIGEAIALDRTDVQGDMIVVDKTMDVRNGNRKDRTKTSSSTREVFIQPELMEVVKNIRRFVLHDQIRNGYRSTLFLPGFNGDFVHYAAYHKYLKENSEKILHRRITPHTLRHTHVSLLAAQGMSLEAIARRVGHEDSKITKSIYFHVTEQLKKKDQDEIRNIKIL